MSKWRNHGPRDQHQPPSEQMKKTWLHVGSVLLQSTRKKLLEHEKKNGEKHSTASRVSLLNNLSQLLKI